MKPIDIAPADLEIVQRILSQYVPSLEVRAFGSRVTWNARAISDLDLALFTTEPLDFTLKAELREAFAQSNLPFRVDIVDWAATPEDFQEVIAQEYVVISRALSEKQRGTDKLMETTLGNCTINETAHSPKTAWPLIEIGTVAQIQGGSTPSTRNPDNFGGGIAWITPKDLSTTQFRFLSEGSRTLSSQGLKNCSARLVPRGTVLLSTRAPIGLVAIASKELATNQGIRNLIPSKDVTSEYLYYWLKANTAVLEQHAAGTTFSELSGTALKQIQLRIPPLPEQRAIAHVLGTLDDKIELNHRMNQTLETITQKIFESWFIRFDPVRAKIDGSWSKNKVVTDLLSFDFYDLFPSCFEKSEIGEIPKGWEVKNLGDIVNIVKGRSYRSSELAESDTALITLKSFVKGGGYKADGLKPYIGRYKSEQIAEPGEVIVACTDITQDAEVIGYPALVRPSINFERLIISLDALIVRPKDRYIGREFLYCLCKTNAFTNHTASYTTGTTVLHLNKRAVPAFKVAMPKIELAHIFCKTTSPMFKQIFTSELESENLNILRAYLLPNLISGRLKTNAI